jgi:hypothetical protein
MKNNIVSIQVIIFHEKRRELSTIDSNKTSKNTKNFVLALGVVSDGLIKDIINWTVFW